MHTISNWLLSLSQVNWICKSFFACKQKCDKWSNSTNSIVSEVIIFYYPFMCGAMRVSKPIYLPLWEHTKRQQRRIEILQFNLTEPTKVSIGISSCLFIYDSAIHGLKLRLILQSTRWPQGKCISMNVCSFIK